MGNYRDQLVWLIPLRFFDEDKAVLKKFLADSKYNAMMRYFKGHLLGGKVLVRPARPS